MSQEIWILGSNVSEKEVGVWHLCGIYSSREKALQDAPRHKAAKPERGWWLAQYPEGLDGLTTTEKKELACEAV